jgi:uncharacterized protein
VKIENRFTVKAPIGEVWEYLLDVERVAPCMPGAELTEVVDERTYKGKVSVKVGPVSLSFAGTVVKQEEDAAAHRVVLKADGREQRGKGAASATVVSELAEAAGGGTDVSIDADVTITGAVAQYGRGMIQDISQRLTNQFAGCLEESLSASATDEPAPAAEAAEATGPAAAPAGATAASSGGSPTATGGAAGATANPAAPSPAAPRPATAVRPQAKPVKGFRLGLWAFWRAVVRFFQRLFGRGEK